jgi:hypothetical protein
MASDKNKKTFMSLRKIVAPLSRLKTRWIIEQGVTARLKQQTRPKRT